jgi:hypothetical protein
MFFLFGGYDAWDTKGGMNDFRGTFATYEEAFKAAWKPAPTAQRLTWFQIATIVNGELVLEAYCI